MSLIEGLCLVAIGAAMVELHDSHRFARPEILPAAALARPAQPAGGAGEARSPDVSNGMSARAGYR